MYNVFKHVMIGQCQTAVHVNYTIKVPIYTPRMAGWHQIYTPPALFYIQDAYGGQSMAAQD